MAADKDSATAAPEGSAGGTPQRAFGIDIGGIDLGGMARRHLLGLADDGRGNVVDSLDQLVALAGEFAGQLGPAESNMVAGFAQRAVDSIADIRDALRDRPIEALIADGEDLLRRQPQIVVGLAALAGFLTVRLLKADR